MDVTKVFEVSLEDIKLKGINVRKDLSKEGILELAESIKEYGLMQPIVLRGENGFPPYDVIVGQRRFLAHEELGKKTIKATFTGEIDDIKAVLLSLSENIQREELNYSDTADAVTKLYVYYGRDEKKVQKALGLSIRKIRDYIRLEEQATEKLKALLSKSDISMADAKRAIDAAQGDLEKADLFIDEIVKLTKNEKKRFVEESKQNPNADSSEILKKAKKPRFEETVILNMSIKLSKAINKASDIQSLDREVLILKVVEDWLVENDYI